jgi:molybdate transport system substrate-binding protein
VIGKTDRRFLLRCGAVALALLPALAAVPAVAAEAVLVFAAASLKNALDDAAREFEKEGGTPVKISYAASSALARQIENGAPADIFISADLDWMDYVEKRHLIRPPTRRNLLGNRLVLVAPADSRVKIEIAPGFDLLARLEGGRLAMADPESVPAGKYGKTALTTLGVWRAVARHIAAAENVRAALRFVARRETPLGIVYATDAAAEPKVRVVGVFPAGSYPPILYPVALSAGSTNPNARRFLDFLESPAARPAFERQGFAVLGPAG